MTSPVRQQLRRLAMTIALATGAALLPGARADTVTHNRMVVQVSDADPQKWSLALTNAYNVMNGVAPDTAEIEIVVYGPGIGMLKRDSAVAQRVASAIDSGIRFVACENTMEGEHLTPADMLPRIGYVQAAAVELMLKQQQGYTYLRP